jgi:hypothetical protein
VDLADEVNLAISKELKIPPEQLTDDTNGTRRRVH